VQEARKDFIGGVLGLGSIGFLFWLFLGAGVGTSLFFGLPYYIWFAITIVVILWVLNNLSKHK